MKIVILDGYTTNPGDGSWNSIRELGDLTVYDRTRPEETLTRSFGASVLLVNKVIIGKEHIDALPDLRYIGLLSTGANVVDLAAARDRNIIVSNIPSYSTDSVAQWAFGHLINLASRIAESSAAVHKGEWCSSSDFCFWHGPLIELSGKTLGIVGFGTIGRKVARLALALGMKVIAFGPHLTPGKEVDGVRSVEMEELLKQSDAISLHCPLTDTTRHLIDRLSISLMKQGALLVNTSRGPLLNEQDVADALNSGKLGGLGADVLSTEPPLSNNPLLTAKNCFLTPHNAWASREARTRLRQIAADNIKAFLEGNPQNVVR